MTPLVSRREAAKRTGIKESYLYALAVRGEIAYIVLPSRSGRRRRGRIMFRLADLEAFIASHRTEAAL